MAKRHQRRLVESLARRPAACVGKTPVTHDGVGTGDHVVEFALASDGGPALGTVAVAALVALAWPVPSSVVAVPTTSSVWP